MTIAARPGHARQDKTAKWEEALQAVYGGFRQSAAEALEEFDVKAVHSARVHTRKLLTLLGLLDPSKQLEVYRSFKSIQKRLGRVRDADVLIGAFKKKRRVAKAEENAKTAKLLKSVIKLRKEARKGQRQKLARKLPKLAGGKLDAQWEHFLRDQLPQLAAGLDVNVVMRELEVAYEQQKKTVKQLFKNPESGAAERFEALHALRIGAKKLRYTADAASFALNSKFHAHEQIYKEVQDELGAVNDLHVWLEAMRETDPGELKAGAKALPGFIGKLEQELDEAVQKQEAVQL